MLPAFTLHPTRLNHGLSLLGFAALLLFNIHPAYAIYEDFDSPPTSQWSLYGGHWRLQNGVAVSPNGPGYKAVSHQTFTDVDVSMQLKVDSGQSAGIIFRVTEPAEGADSFKGYYAYIEPGNKLVAIGKLNNDWRFITGVSADMTAGVWYQLGVKAIGPNIQVYLDGNLQIEIHDEEHPSGAVGVRNWHADASLDEFKALAPAEGIYAVQGTDYVGAYTGTAELRYENGGYKFIKLVDYTDFTYQSYAVSAAQEGSATVGNDGTVRIAYELDLVGFISQQGGLARDPDFHNNAPIAITQTLSPLPDGQYDGVYGGVYKGYSFSFNETWSKSGNNPTQPIWQNQRVDLATVENPASATLDRTSLISDFDEAEYHAKPEVAPYAGRAEFQEKIHFWVHDPTDYDYYQNNPQRLRVIQKVIDPISLAETLLRNDAYRWKLHEKETHLAAEVQRLQINELGFVSRWLAGENRYTHEGDSLLWTGVYVAAMAKKYLITKDPATLEHMLKSLNAVINAIEIVRDNPDDSLSDTFARSIMLERGRADTDPEWRRGTMQYSPVTQVEYKRGGNNDMSKGIFIGMLWGGKALQALSADDYAKVVSQYGDIRERMTRSVMELRNAHGKLFLSKCRTLEFWDAPQWPNTIHINLVLYGLNTVHPLYVLDWNDDIKVCYEALRPYWGETGTNFINFAGSTSDWSGNHLGIWGLYNNYESFRQLAGEMSGEADKFRGYLQDADEQMLTHQLGFFRLVSGALRHNYNANAVEMAIWKLKEIPLRRGGHVIDWTINPKFTLSPYPALPWKYDSNNPIYQSLRAYPLFETVSSSYLWKDNPFDRFRGYGPTGDSGIDFLIAYWFGRYHGVIAAQI